MIAKTGTTGQNTDNLAAVKAEIDTDIEKIVNAEVQSKDTINNAVVVARNIS